MIAENQEGKHNGKCEVERKKPVFPAKTYRLSSYFPEQYPHSRTHKQVGYLKPPRKPEITKSLPGPAGSGLDRSASLSQH